MPDFSGIRSALLEFAANPTSSAALPAVLGLSPVSAPSDLLHDRTQPISSALSPVAEGLYRVGALDADLGSAGFYVVPLREWGARSVDRDRARRRVAKTLVEHAPYGDRRWLIALIGGQDHDVELVLPRVREERRGVATVRALVQADSPSHFHLALLADLALAPGMSLQEISRKWNEAFSVERVTKRFYLEFRELRNRIAEELVHRNANIPAIASADRRADLDRFVTRQLGRLLFLWFLQAKRWLDANSRFFEDLFERHCRGAGARNFFRDLLVPLFFDALASPASSKRRTVANELFGAVPYLNGGLFLQTSYEDDLFGKDREHVNVDLPNELFDRRLHRDGVPTVLGLLSNYRFATRESTPDDMSVDPDPELLGKVFENLNEDRERHDTGTYYTPREIVHFMCREALDGYLQDAAGVDRSLLQQLRSAALEDEPPEKRLPDADRERLEQALDAVKICDPAVGSGAFLVGSMQEIILLKRGIAHSSSPFRDPEPAEVASWKRRIISNSLYGVDISPEAIEICQLRLWLSLVLEEEQPEPLPNLDFRIVAGDSLIDRAGDIAFEDSIPRPELQYDLETHERLEHLRRSIAALRDEFAEERDPRRARRLRHGIRERQMEIVRRQLDRHIETAQAQAAAMTAKRSQAERLAAPERTLKQHISAVKQAWGKVTELEALRDGLKEDASYRKLFLWPVEFPEVFDEGRGGFDVVLANPPYVRMEQINNLDEKAYALSFPEVAASRADLLVYFYARAVQVLRGGGQLSFITSNSFARRSYGKKLQQYLSQKLTIRSVIDFGEAKIFEATVEPYVLVASKCRPPADHEVTTHNLQALISRRAASKSNVAAIRRAIEELPTLLQEERGILPQERFHRSGWKAETLETVEIFEQLGACGRPLGELIQGEMYCGVKTGLNEAFVVDAMTAQALLAADPAAKECIKPYVRGRDVRRWVVRPSGLYLIFAHRGWPIEEHPVVKQHLEQHKDQLMRRATVGSHPWHELQQPQEGLYRLFEEPKVMWPNIARRIRFAWETEGAYPDMTAFFTTRLGPAHVALLNSEVGEFLICMLTNRARGGFAELKQDYLFPFPVPEISPDQAAVLEKLCQKGQGGASSPDFESHLTGVVASMYGISEAAVLSIRLWLSARSMSDGEDDD